MLLKTTDELKTYFSNIDRDYNFGSIESFVFDAETDIVIPEISQELYDSLQVKYDDNTLADKAKQAFVLIQRAISHFALYLSADSGSFRISDAGFYVTVGTDTRPVSDKKMIMFRKGRTEAGYKALDQAISFLDNNVNETVFAAYKNSDIKKEAANYFLSNCRDFTRYFSPLRNSSTTYRAMLSAIGQAESDYIMPILGDALFDSLKSKVKQNGLNDDEKVLMQKIQKALANLTIAEAIPMLSFDFDGKTLSVNNLKAAGESSEETTSLSDQRLSNLMNHCLMNGQADARRLKTWLNTNASKFPGFIAEASNDDFNINDSSSKTFFV
jgi:hypothetical protein